ncbi:hypothetical protein KIW84_063181 [Lathyrus oleraceus]|uniref:Photosystem I iron-sulfur center n=2 Tax=fabids TaxID=91835 RepID=A0A9D4W7V8_PEA|nr:hypothetical protein KIW84_063181 [Pisum sativum]
MSQETLKYGSMGRILLTYSDRGEQAIRQGDSEIAESWFDQAAEYWKQAIALTPGIGCTQCVRACPTDVLEMIPWGGCKAKQIASAPRTEDCVGCKRCESACPTDFLSVRVYLWHETTRSMGLAY